MSADVLTRPTPAPTPARKPDKVPKALIALCLLIGLVSHGWNMFRYPLYLTDEGIYMEQAWSVIKEGKLSPYTYFYDHAPMGWLASCRAGSPPSVTPSTPAGCSCSSSTWRRCS